MHNRWFYHYSEYFSISFEVLKLHFISANSDEINLQSMTYLKLISFVISLIDVSHTDLGLFFEFGIYLCLAWIAPFM